MDNSQEYAKILVGIDGSEQANDAFKKAIEVARRNNARVIVAHVIENQVYGLWGYSPVNDNLLENESDNGKSLLKQCKEYAESVNYDNIEAVLTYGSAKEVMCHELPEKYRIDLIMVGQSGLNAVERFMMGSVASYIIRNAPCDVLICYPDEKKK
ncbi:universal stress protein [Enterococcus hirae]|jgi:nucleotide-binding universal stress UspA family protein|nr:universal stress protein [Enterococcaceae bacterium]MCI1919489.1 universal stress protein [Enterococcaceae bacterium]MDM8213668.1 universal stress protein [Enterococcus hirae]